MTKAGEEKGQQQKTPLVIGIGNSFRRDDGIGLRVVKQLQDECSELDCLICGSDVFHILDVIGDYSMAVLVDAVNMDEKPATVKLFDSRKAVLKIKSTVSSTHGIGLAEIMQLIDVLGVRTQLQVIGIQPHDLSFGENLSEPLASCWDRIMQNVRKYLSLTTGET